jgi:predicted dehydrogenase
MSSHAPLTRRSFLRSTAVTAAALASARKTAAAATTANDRIRLGVIGCGGMGGRHVEALCENANCEIVAVCDVYTPRYRDAANLVDNMTGIAPQTYQDYRHLLDRNDVDAIWIATPDHWHPLLTIHACEAGKDVYVEKPVAPTVAEGRAMIEAARRFGRIVQVGTQQRSMPVFQEAIDLIRSGAIGQVTTASAWVDVNAWEVGEVIEPVPDGLDWDLWLGPAPKVPYSRQRHFGFMGWHDYARGGQLTNWGVHLMDIVHWGIGQDTPLNVQAVGGSYRNQSGADNYEVIEAIFEYPGCSVTWEQRHANAPLDKHYGIRFHGTHGTLAVNRVSFVVYPGALGIPEHIGEPEKSWANKDHHDNFFHCVRTRETPAADIEQGHRSNNAVLLAGIALKVGRKLNWDGARETFIDDPQANRHLTRSYRSPWHF